MNQISQAALLRQRVLAALEAAYPNPLHALDMYDKPEIKEVSKGKDQVIVLLSDMWRGGNVTRVPCVEPGTHVKYAYVWAKPPEPAVKVGKRTIKNYIEEHSPKRAVPYKDKPQITVTEHCVTIELAAIKITIDV